MSAANYCFPGFNFHNGSLTVTKAPLTVTSDNKNKVYGASNPSLTATISGFVNSDTVAVVSGAPTLSTTASTSSGVGGYPITVDSAGTLSAANYCFPSDHFQSGTL